MNKTRMLFDKPIYVGMSILDLSKHLMYDFHYDVMKPKYEEKLKFLYMDTDSFIYRIKTEDFYTDMRGMIAYFDTSDYQEYNPHNMPRCNKKVLGKMKDESNGVIMEEFVGLRSKMCVVNLNEESVQAFNRNEANEEKHKKVNSKRAKGVKKCVVKNRISFEDYKNCLFNKRDHYRTMNLIRSKKHELYSIQVNKKALSGKDDKRYIRQDGIHTLALGHYAIKRCEG
ncbi:hypothetical protein AVEN_175952-1 [Araneus ventricosus]|uniref:DNA-directed DNA polymerase n=1 Tax=Araneus ventricosus TaxID=182803 RepID=A0A4Y2G824_ARAVE|nr:hypothetical protein AVEN_175952-1 [Araneus ventricosus]